MKPLDMEDLYELSPLQQGILFHSLAAEDPGAYLITVSYAFRGDLELPLFERAWQETVDANPVLRTSFHWEDVNKPRWVVHRGVRIAFEELDGRDVEEEEQGERMAALLERERTRGLSLSQAPLMRLAFIRGGADRYRLVWTFHHVVLEGWSAAVLLREVFFRYRALRLGEDVEPEPRRPYRDYILWLQQRDMSRVEAYWRRVLEGFSSPTPLPGTRPAGSGAGPGAYGHQGLSLPAAASVALESLARRNGLTLKTGLQGAWAALRRRYSGAEAVGFGSVCSSRGVTTTDI